jgi:hypothetical protein
MAQTTSYAHSPGQMNPACQSYAGSRSWTARMPQLAAVLITLSPRSTASSAPTSTGMTPRTSTSGSASPLELSEERSRLSPSW